MAIRRAFTGGLLLALAVTSQALATYCGSKCNYECQGLYGGEFTLCWGICYNSCTMVGIE